MRCMYENCAFAILSHCMMCKACKMARCRTRRNSKSVQEPVRVCTQESASTARSEEREITVKKRRCRVVQVLSFDNELIVWKMMQSD